MNVTALLALLYEYVLLVHGSGLVMALKVARSKCIYVQNGGTWEMMLFVHFWVRTGILDSGSQERSASLV